MFETAVQTFAVLKISSTMCGKSFVAAFGRRQSCLVAMWTWTIYEANQIELLASSKNVQQAIHRDLISSIGVCPSGVFYLEGFLVFCRKVRYTFSGDKDTLGSQKGTKMKKLASIGFVAVVLFVVGCAHSTGFNVWQVEAGVNSRAHTWEEPHFTADLTSNPVSSELGLGFVTVGSHAGFTPQDNWVSLNCTVGPEKASGDDGQ